MYKLIAIDIDGTLTNEKGEVSKEVNEAIQKAKAKGVKIVLCSGRPLNGVTPFIKELNLMDEDDYAITYNGALVQNTHTNEAVSNITLAYEDLIDVYGFSLKAELDFFFHDSENVYTFNSNIGLQTVVESYVNNVPLKYRLFDQIPKDIRIPKMGIVDKNNRLAEQFSDDFQIFREKYTIVESMPPLNEITNKEVSKGNAVKRLAELLGIKREEVICIGDGGNDISMIEYAGLGVAMGNAVAVIKEAADFETLSNKENGVAYVIEKFVLNQ